MNAKWRKRLGIVMNLVMAMVLLGLIAVSGLLGFLFYISSQV
ncbi:MAG: hypothetical protein WD178_04885 [Actinomycetota bacterium]